MADENEDGWLLKSEMAMVCKLMAPVVWLLADEMDKLPMLLEKWLELEGESTMEDEEDTDDVVVGEKDGEDTDAFEYSGVIGMLVDE